MVSREQTDDRAMQADQDTEKAEREDCRKRRRRRRRRVEEEESSKNKQAYISVSISGISSGEPILIVLRWYLPDIDDDQHENSFIFADSL